MPKFMLILHDDMSHLSAMAPDEMQRVIAQYQACLLYTSPSPRDRTRSRMPSSA